MTAFTERFSRLRDEWRGNLRLRGGVWLSLAIGLIYLSLALSDLKTAWTGAYSEETLQLQKIRALSGQTVWLTREKAAKTLREALDAEIPEAGTAGLAQAAFQTKLREMTEKYGNAVRLQVSPANRDTAAEGVWRVPASLDGELGLNQIQQLLNDLESQSSLITIESLTLTNRDKARFNVAVQAYYRLPTGEASHAP